MKKEILDYLLSIDCHMRDDGYIYTSHGDYVANSTLNYDPVADFIFHTQLEDLQSIKYAKYYFGGDSVAIGFNRDKNTWYVFKNNKYEAFMPGRRLGVYHELVQFGFIPVNFVCNTIDECKACAIKMYDYLH